MSANTNLKIHFLAGGGTMGQLIRDKNWSNHPLGLPEFWPQSLKTSLSIILNSNFPMFIFWGSEFFCFYNDAYLPSLGTDGKHPAMLGGKGKDHFNELWEGIKPILDQVIDTGISSWNEDTYYPFFRDGKMHDTYWTFSYSVISDEDGKTAGVFSTCYETTEKVLTINQLKESNSRYHNNIEQAPMAMCIFRGKNYIVEAINDLMLKLWEKTSDEVLNLPVFEGVPEAKEQGLEQLLDEVSSTGKRFVANERLVMLSRGGKIEETYVNFIYEALREADGSISGIVVAATEVTEQVKARTILEESEQKVRGIVESAPFAIAVYTGSEMRITMANETIIKIWGKGNDVIGKLFTDVLPELADQLVFEQIKNVYATGIPFNTESTPLDLIVDGNLQTYYFNYSFTPLFDLSGKIYGVMNTGVDLTELVLARKKIEISDLKFRETVRQAPVAIAIFRGMNYLVETANDAYQEIIDRKEIDIINKSIFDTLPEIEQSIRMVFDEVMHTGIPYNGYDVPAILKRNGIFQNCYFDLLFHPLREEDGSISGLIVTAVETTEKVASRIITEQNAERLRIVVEASELGTWEHNFKTQEFTYSDRFINIVGGYPSYVQFSFEEIQAHVHPEDVIIREKAIEQALTSGYLHYELRIIWLDKSIHYMEVKGKVFYDEANVAFKIIGTVQDCTNERNDRQLLIDSEKKFRLLSNSMPQHIWTSDPKGKFTYFNQSVLDFTGLSNQQLFDGEWYNVLHQEERIINARNWSESIKNGKDFILEHRFRGHDGIFRWHLSRAIPQRDENSNIQMWVGSSTDIEEQKTFASELEKQVAERTADLLEMNESLLESEQRYQFMVGEVKDYAIMYLSPEGIVQNWNKGAEKIKGYNADEIVGKNFDIFYSQKERDHNFPIYLLNQARELGRFIYEGYSIRKDGSKFWAIVSLTAVHNNENKIIGFSKVTQDISAKKAADEEIQKHATQLQEKNIELEKMNKELESFAYISSHDLQEPLRKIQTFSSQLVDIEFNNLSDSGKDKFKRMQNAANRMQTLINDLLAYSRSNSSDRNLITTDLNQIIADVKNDLKEELLQKKAVINSEEVKCEVDVIPFQIQQMLYNLLSNALKFSREGISTIITIKCEINKGKDIEYDLLEENTEYCHLTIADNGIGFEAQYSLKIFEVFQRLHGREVYQGTGIGLAIVKKIVDNHKGFITAHGELNVGATFNIYIPLKAS